MKQIGSTPRRTAMRWPFISGNHPTGSNVAGTSTEHSDHAQDGSIPSFDLGSFSPDKTSTKQAGKLTIHDGADNEPVPVIAALSGTVGMPTPHSPLTENVIYSECALAAKWDVSQEFLNLNATSLAAEYSDSPIIKRPVKPGRFARSPWAMGVEHPTRDQELTHSLYVWITSTLSPEFGRPWLVHNKPRYIEVSGPTIKKAVTCSECWGYDLFDLAIRRIQQLDRGMYTAEIIWRLIFESDFAMHALGNANPAENVAVRSQFTGNGVEFEIQRCRQIIVPLRRPKSWCAYAWDMKLHKTTILDPMAAMTTEQETLEAHKPTIEKLHASLANCAELLFDGWAPAWEKWDIVAVKSDNMTASIEQSGLYTLFNIINFDGQKFAVEPTPEAINSFKEHWLYEMMSLEDNKGKVPSIFVETIED